MGEKDVVSSLNRCRGSQAEGRPPVPWLGCRERRLFSFSKALALRCRAHRLELKDLQIPVHEHTQLSEPLVNLTQKRERPRH